ncbi:3536_t:CDS:2, partial [Funneliformis geosporum]
MSYNFHSDLLKDFYQLLQTEIDYNVVIQVGKSNSDEKHVDVKELHQNQPPIIETTVIQDEQTDSNKKEVELEEGHEPNETKRIEDKLETIEEETTLTLDDEDIESITSVEPEGDVVIQDDQMDSDSKQDVDINETTIDETKVETKVETKIETKVETKIETRVETKVETKVENDVNNDDVAYNTISRSVECDKIDSELITQLHMLQFANWIDRKEANSKYIKAVPYEFNLLYRGSKDKFSAKSFHKKCDKKDSTIIIAKVKNSNQMVGGYNPLNWGGNGVKGTSDSFIFSFDDYRDINTGEIGRVVNSECAVQCLSNYGPIFGSYVTNLSVFKKSDKVSPEDQ